MSESVETAAQQAVPLIQLRRRRPVWQVADVHELQGVRLEVVRLQGDDVVLRPLEDCPPGFFFDVGDEFTVEEQAMIVARVGRRDVVLHRRDLYRDPNSNAATDVAVS